MKVCELQIQVGHANKIINFDKCYTYDTLSIQVWVIYRVFCCCLFSVKDSSHKHSKTKDRDNDNRPV